MRTRTPRRALRVGIATALASVFAVVLSLAAGLPAQATSYVNIDGEGSTWAAPAWHTWSTLAAGDGVTVNYTPNGSSTGRDDFAKQTQAMFADSEITFRGDAEDPNDAQQATFQYSMLPVAAGGTAFGYNLPVGGSSNYLSLRLNMATLAGIFSGEIFKWNAPQIQALNPGVALPAQNITVVVRGDGSGTTAQFKLWMLRQFPADYRHLALATKTDPTHATSYFPVGTLGSCAPTTPCFVSQNASTGVSTYVQHVPYTISYDEYEYFRLAGLPVAHVENAAGFFTVPDQFAVAVALIAAKINTNKNDPNYLSQNLSNVYGYKDPRAYPMSMYTYEFIPDQTTAVLTKPQGATLAWTSTNVVCSWQDGMGDLGYSPLPMNLVLASMQQIEKIPGIDAATQATITTTQNGVTGGHFNPCNSPTFKPGQSPNDNVLVQTAPFPPGCDAACQAPWKGKTITGGPGPSPSPSPRGPSHSPSPSASGPGHSPSPSASGPGNSPSSGPGSPSSGPTSPAGAGPSCNAATGVCTTQSGGPTSGALGNSGSGNVATVIPTAAGWASPQTLGIIVVVLLAAVLVVPPVVAARARRRGGRG